MLHRISRSLINLFSQRQFYLLLLLLAPLMFSLHWIAVRFPNFFPDYVQTFIYEVESDKLAVVFEYYGLRGKWGELQATHWRAWLLDIETETLKPIARPPEIEAEWPVLLGQDRNGDLIFQTYSGVKNYVSWNVRTCATDSFKPLPSNPVLINDRFLACIEHDALRTECEFVWCDLNEPNRPHRRTPIMETGGNLIPVDGTDSFYFVLPTESQDWWGSAMMEGMESKGRSDEIPASDFSREWLNEDGSMEYELPPVVVNPNSVLPHATAVLMKLTEHGPKEVTRWPVYSSDRWEVTDIKGHIISQSMDASFLETRDARSGAIVARVPIPKIPLTTNGSSRFEHWRASGRLVDFNDGTGIRVAFNATTGMELEGLPLAVTTTGLFDCDQDSNEYLVHVTQSWTDFRGEIQVRFTENNQLRHAWVPPAADFSPSNVHFTVEGEHVVFFTTDLRVLFVDKATGQVVRRIQPRFWLPMLAAILALATLVWLYCWIRVAIRSGISLWVDELIFFAVAMTYLYWRINLSGDPYEKQRLAWVCFGSLLIAALTVVVNETLFRSVRLLYRCAPIILLTVAAIFGQWKWIVFDNASEILGELMLIALVISFSTFAYVLFFRRQQVACGDSIPIRRGFSLAELFAWTALVALMLAPLKLYPWDEWTRLVSPTWITEILCVVSIIVSFTLPAYFLTAKRCYLVYRLLGVGVLAVLIAGAVVFRQGFIDADFNLIGTMTIVEVGQNCEYLIVFVLGSVLVALPVGMRNIKCSKKS